MDEVEIKVPIAITCVAWPHALIWVGLENGRVLAEEEERQFRGY